MHTASKDTALPIILLIDGQCLLCNNITRFVVKHDRRKQFRFAALQSHAGKKLLREGNLPLEDMDTFVMIHNGQYFTKSDAALLVLRKLNRSWSLCYLFIAVPQTLRNRIYDGVARNRFRYFGKTDTCLIPTPELMGRFVQDGVYEANEEAAAT
ncbi:thiol-disulfide oxidoreductase DCC family protein [Paenibacillus sp. 2TAB23]|uniref:thiol-disulfide oxidoreductase DCC family protein n=1 Tax=Paenibacillus sp. 2TAB23 TaxID=3233004 RepID=UPI003F9DA84E